MLKALQKHLLPLPSRYVSIAVGALRPFSAKRWDDRGSGFSEEELDAARDWLAKLRPQTIPRNICSVSYSTSSGPGGQNVNRSNTKATLTVPIASLLPLVPKPLHAKIRSSQYFAKNSESLVIQSQETRNRTTNLNRCFDKLVELLTHAGEESIPGKTSPEQREKVKRLQEAEKKARMQWKKAQSQKKQSRKGRSFDD
ncbi:hypothetical protein VTO42DRAFT_8590 [Malbranchea cinnamomea]